jgi:putative ABC transport system permease protein
MSAVPLSTLDLALAAALILINGAVSLGFGLGLERHLAIVSLRMVVQLAAIGLVLKFVFTQTSPWWTVALAAVMIVAAGYEAVARGETRIAGWRSWGLGTGTLLAVGTLATLFAVAGLIGPEPWYAPRYLLPILGMVLGNMLVGVGLVLETIGQSVRREKAAIEARLALGETRFAALDDVVKRALRMAMMPILNGMAASGLVALPGMMTGQILAGADPVEATKYQILIMFLLAGATAAAVVLAGLGAVLLVTDERHRLRLERVAVKGETSEALGLSLRWRRRTRKAG